jgi:hypothetical protein
MSKAQLVITAVVLGGAQQKEVARDYDVSRYRVQQLCKRYATEGAAAFEPRSRRPHHHPHAVGGDVEERIVRCAKPSTYRATTPAQPPSPNTSPATPQSQRATTLWVDGVTPVREVRTSMPSTPSVCHRIGPAAL